MSLSVDMRETQSKSSTDEYDVVVIGAGPYGLSAAAHLLGQGLKVAVFGRPLQLWREHMPQGMKLRSYWWATNLSDPEGNYSLRRYFELLLRKAPHPLPIETFINYAMWFQREVVPNVDETYVSDIKRQSDNFTVELQDGRSVFARAVVMAPGMGYYIYRPEQYTCLPSEMVSHASAHHTFEQFNGKRVIIIGGGQSALEISALLTEQGAQVDLVSRHPIRWLTELPVDQRSLYETIRYPKAGIAPGWFNWGLEHFPYSFQSLPRTTKERLMQGRGRYGPAGSGWLKPRIVGKVALYENHTVQHLDYSGGEVVLNLPDITLRADHVILATGYRVDIRNLPMLNQEMLQHIRTYQHAPVLNHQFESSVPGLFFVGLSSVSSFGPLYRFVVGAGAAARRIADSVAQHVINAA